MIEKLKENKRLVIIIVSALLILLVIIILLVVLSSPSAPDDDSASEPEQPPAPVQQPTPPPPVDDGDEPTEPAGDQEVTITWWGAFLSQDDVQPLIDAYEADNPGVTVNYSNEVLRRSELPSYQVKVQDVLANGGSDAPDLIMIDNGWAGLYIPELEPAPQEIATGAQVDSNFYEFVSTDFVEDDQVYGLPLWVDTFALIYNEDLYEEAGLVSPAEDWQTFVDDQLPELTAANDSDEITQAGFAGTDTSNTEFWFEALNILMWQNGANIIDNSGQAALADDADAEDAVAFYQQFTEGDTASWSSEFNVDVAAFLEGKLATYMAPSWRLNDIVRYNDAGDLGLNFGVSAIPQLSASSGQESNMAIYWANVVNADSPQSFETWQFLNFLTQSQQLETLNNTMLDNGSTEIGIIYPRSNMSSIQSNDQYLGVYVNSLPSARSWDMVDKISVKDSFEGLLTDNDNLSEVETQLNDNILIVN
jgi:multiple sugar transport system substrate-binding protein